MIVIIEGIEWVGVASRLLYIHQSQDVKYKSDHITR